MITIRPVRVPGDYARIAELVALFRNVPVSTQDILEDDKKYTAADTATYDQDGRMVSQHRHRSVAVSADGQILGYLSLSRMGWTAPGKLIMSLYVDPLYRHRGVGRALLQAACAHAKALRATVLQAELRDNDPAALRFAENAGFTLKYQMFESVLALENFDNTAFEEILPAVTETGIRFYTLKDEPGPETEQALYELDRVTSPDVPEFDGGFPDFVQWREWNIAEDSLPDCFILAADGDRPVGATWMSQNAQTKAMYTQFTCVLKQYRGRKIALALKLLAIAAARRHGAPLMRTNNNSLNAGMLAVNSRLGYQPEPGWYYMALSLA